MPDRERILRWRGLLVDLGHAIAHGIALVVLAGTVRYLASTVEKTFGPTDPSLSGLTRTALDGYHLLRTHWYVFPLALAADYGALRFGRRRLGGDRPAAGYSVGVLLAVVLVLGFSVVALVHPWTATIKKLS